MPEQDAHRRTQVHAINSHQDASTPTCGNLSALRFGRQPVPVADEDEALLKYQVPDKQLALIGFMEKKHVRNCDLDNHSHHTGTWNL